MRKCLLVLCCLMLSVAGCAKSPSCSKAAVKQKVIETSKGLLMMKMFAPLIFSLNDKDPADQAILTSYGLNHQLPDINVMKQSKTPAIVEYCKDVESKTANLTIESIRTVSKDDTAKKCNCEADVVVDKDTKLPIQYSAQKTDDGEIRVEVNMH